jgi:hypothetical protein
VKATGRTSEKTFVNAIRTALAAKYGEEPVGVGGVFIIGKGKAKLHVMPDFSKTPLTTDQEVEDWLHFYECNAPLTMLSTFVSHDPGLDLRVEHTHGFSVRSSSLSSNQPAPMTTNGMEVAGGRWCGVLASPYGSPPHHADRELCHQKPQPLPH